MFLHQQVRDKKANGVARQTIHKKTSSHRSKQYLSTIIQRVQTDPDSLTLCDVLQLQRTIGNQAVGRVLSEIGKLPEVSHPVHFSSSQVIQGDFLDYVKAFGSGLKDGVMLDTWLEHRILDETKGPEELKKYLEEFQRKHNIK